MEFKIYDTFKVIDGENLTLLQIQSQDLDGKYMLLVVPACNQAFHMTAKQINDNLLSGLMSRLHEADKVEARL